MAEHFLQVENGPTLPQIVHREGVPECVQCVGWWVEAS